MLAMVIAMMMATAVRNQQAKENHQTRVQERHVCEQEDASGRREMFYKRN